ncbi:MAG: hypothetical protein IKS12_07505 [Eubacterium sp.]|nr:hypothetical protein [Eubacterium sp.]MBR7073302.1 hypothetical protein [Eubacterium sp.]
MRKILNLNENWLFEMNGKTKTVSLPHCFNAADGLTPDYVRTRCAYTKELAPLKGNVLKEQIPLHRLP